MLEGLFILALLTGLFLAGRYILKHRERSRTQSGESGGGGGRNQPK